VTSERARQVAADLQHRIDIELPRLFALTVTVDIRSGLESLNAEIQVQNKTYPGNPLPLLDIGQLMKERDLRHRG